MPVLLFIYRPMSLVRDLWILPVEIICTMISEGNFNYCNSPLNAASRIRGVTGVFALLHCRLGSRVAVRV